MIHISGPESGVFFAGNDLAWEFSVTDEHGDPVNLADFTFQFALARTAYGALPVLSTGVSPPTVATEATSVEGGLWEARVSAADSELLQGTYEYQAQVVDGGGLRSNLLHGYFTFKRNLFAVP